MKIRVGARRSPLSKAQVEEVWQLVRKHHPEIVFEPIFVDTHGDRDKKTSLRALEKTDFFTRELDHMLLAGECDIVVHSAKDLPEPLPEGIVIAAITEGVDPSDSLVLKPGTTLQPGMVIATSSERREEAVSALCSGVKFVDIRGNIGERLAVLERGEVDGVVIAEAALVRLKLTHLHRLTLPGETVPFQGQLAIACLEEGLSRRCPRQTDLCCLNCLTASFSTAGSS